jgi:hypothetical protein
MIGIMGKMTGKFVAYYRVSTDKQGISGLGMDAQKQAVANYLNGGSWNLLAEFSEVETGRRSDRHELAKAVALCRKEGATLLIAKLDRLARNAAFLLNLRDSGVNFVATDMPHADRFTVGVMALVAEKEAEMISQRTKDGLVDVGQSGANFAAGRELIVADHFIAGTNALRIVVRNNGPGLNPHGLRLELSGSANRKSEQSRTP